MTPQKKIGVKWLLKKITQKCCGQVTAEQSLCVYLDQWWEVKYLGDFFFVFKKGINNK